MVVFVANRRNLQTRRLHDRIKNRLDSDGVFSDARLVRTSPRDPGAYRVEAETDPREFLGDPSYPVTESRVVVGFDLFTTDPYEHYWLNWVEPTRGVLVGWHQDGTHGDLGEVHVQVNDGDQPVAHEPATFVDSHPLDVSDRRLSTLPDLVAAVEWSDGRPSGLDW